MLWPKETPILDVKGEWVFYPLPHQSKIIEALNRNKARQFELKREVRERSMNFTEAVQKAKHGGKVRRTTWDKDMFMWWNANRCFHTHPYDETQNESQVGNGFYYVVEKDDATANDWELVEV